MDSITSSSCFSPKFTSSPSDRNRTRSDRNITRPRLSTDTDNASSLFCVSEKRNFRVMNINCRSVVNNNSEFQAALNYIKPDIVCGTESWLRGVKPGKPDTVGAIKSSEVFPSHFAAYRNDRGSLGGGVFVLVHKDLVALEQPDLVTNCEITWVQVKLKDKKSLQISSFYMPKRNMKDIHELRKSLELATSDKEKQIILVGDFNCPDIDWQSLTIGNNAQDRDVQQALVDLAIDFNLTQIHNQPTRENNLLDLVFTTKPSLIKSSTNAPGISDHDIVVVDSDTKPFYVKQKPRKCLIYSKADWNMLKNSATELSRKVTKAYRKDDSVHTLWDTFKNDLMSAIEKCIPSKMIRSNSSTPWIRGKVKRALRRKARLYRKARKTKNWSNYRKYQRECKREIRSAEWTYINRTITDSLKENNNKPFWKYIKSKKEDNIGVAPLKAGNHLVTDGKGKAEQLINQFQSVFTKDDNMSFEQPPTQVKDNIPLLTIREKGVHKLLKDIKVNKASGPDSLPNRVLKECAYELSPGITAIFQKSIDSGELPDDWRNANISPVYKKGDRHLPQNYRPVSLTSVISKLMEHIVCRHLLNHLDKHHVLTNLNHGFRAGYSCETQLAATTHDLLSSFDSGTQTDVMILDFSKAFDTVPHRKLMAKLEAYGIKGNIHLWISNFLMKRNMSVVVDGEKSREVTVESGVPQGTVLGPLLFLCHINDLPECVSSKVRLFADDCLLYRNIKKQSDHLALQQDLDNLQCWADKWGMRFNETKCYHLSIRQKSLHFYTIKGHILKQVQDNPYLGITFSETMKWSTHINQLRNKANSMLGFLRRNLRHTPESCRKNAYLALVRSKLDYGSVIWDPYTKTDIEKLERIQHAGVRFITKDYRSRHEGCITEMLCKQGLPTLKDRRQQQRLTLMYKVVEGQVPALNPDHYFQKQKRRRAIKSTKFTDCVQTNIIDNYVTNNSKCFKPIYAKSEQFKNSFFVRTVPEWNRLSEDIISAKTVHSFQRLISGVHSD